MEDLQKVGLKVASLVKDHLAAGFEFLVVSFLQLVHRDKFCNILLD